MSNFEDVKNRLVGWKASGSHTGDLAALRRMDTEALQVLAREGAFLKGPQVKGWLVVGYMISLGIPDVPKKGAACFYSSGISEERMRQLLGGRDIADGVRRSAGMLKAGVDMTDVFWSVVNWDKPEKRKGIQADWWMAYYGGKDVSDKDADKA